MLRVPDTCGTYKLLRNLLEPEKPKDKTFEQMVEKLTITTAQNL